MKKIFSLALVAMMAILAMAQYPNRVYLCGPAGPGWQTEQWPMFTEVEADGVTPTGMYEWIGDLNDGELKLLHGSSWEPGYAPAVADEPFTVGDHSVVDRPDGSYPDDKWAVTAGRYKMVLNIETMTLTVSDGTGLEDKDGSEQEFEAPVPANVYPVGDGTEYGWNPGSADPIAKAEGADVFDGVVFLKNGEFKLMHQPDWGAQYGPMEGGEIIDGAGTYTLCKPSEDNKWRIEGIEELTAFHMIADVEAGTLVLRDTNIVLPALAQLYAIGDAVGGWDHETNAVVLLPKEGVDSVYYAEGVSLVMGELKFTEKKGWGGNEWGALIENDPIMEGGTYYVEKLDGDVKFLVMGSLYVNIMVDIKEGEMVLTEVQAPEAIENNAISEKACKMLIDGQLLIKKGARVFNVLGF